MYVVRNNSIGEADPEANYLGHLYCTETFKNATRFSDLEEAKSKLFNFGYAGRAVYEVTYVLRWYQEGKRVENIPYPYYSGTKGNGCKDQAASQSTKTCTRFATREEAIKVAGEYAYPRGGSIFADTGWRAIRVLRKVK